MGLTENEIEEGLTDKKWQTRHATAKKMLLTGEGLSPQQIQRGLKDRAWFARGFIEFHRKELLAQWEAAELKKRHASVTIQKPKLEAL